MAVEQYRIDLYWPDRGQPATDYFTATDDQAATDRALELLNEDSDAGTTQAFSYRRFGINPLADYRRTGDGPWVRDGVA